MADIDVEQVTQDANQGPVRVGSIFAERFEIIGLLGRGGMSTVYKARQVAMDRVVALKIMHESLSSDSKGYQRLRREAQAVGALNHPNIVKVHSFGTDGSRPYLAMDMVEGKSLASMLAQNNTLSAAQLLPIIVPIAKALAHAHAAGILHRDVKPSNIMICENPPADGANVYLVDFGIAKLLENEPGAQNLTSDLIGTYAYMSPEQIERAELDGRSDMYSLGCVIYCALTGAPPFDGESLFATIYSHLNDEPKPLPPLVPAYLSGITMRMLAKKRDDRFANMDEVVAALEQQMIPQAVPKARRSIRSVPKGFLLGALGLAATISLVLIALPKPNDKPRPTFKIDPKEERLDPARKKWNTAVMLGSQDGRDTATDAMIAFHSSHGPSKMGLTAARDMLDQYRNYFDPPVKDWARFEMELLNHEWAILQKSDTERQVEFLKNRMWPIAKLNGGLQQMLCVQHLLDRNALTGKELKDALYSMEPFIARVEAHDLVEKAQYWQATACIARNMLSVNRKKAFEMYEIMLRKSRQYFGADTPEYASVLASKVTMLRADKQYQEAEALARQVIPVLQKGDDEHKDQSTCVYWELHDIAVARKDLVSAAREAEKAALYWDTVVPSDKYKKKAAITGISLNLQLATDYILSGRHSGARKPIERAYQYLSKLRPAERESYPQAAFMDASTLWVGGERQKARQVLAEARSIEDKYHFGTLHSALVYFQSANFATAGEAKDALRYAETALGMLREMAGKDAAVAYYLPLCEKKVTELRDAVKSGH